jgi:hypothetical protein
MEFSVNVFARFFKLVHALSQASGQIWQLLRTEKNKHDKKDNKYVGATEVSKAKCEYIHNYIYSIGEIIIPLKPRDFAKEKSLSQNPRVEESKDSLFGSLKKLQRAPLRFKRTLENPPRRWVRVSSPYREVAGINIRYVR